MSEERSLEDLRDEIRRLFQSDQIPGASERALELSNVLIARTVKEKFENPEDYLLRGRVFINLCRYPDARGSFSQAIALRHLLPDDYTRSRAFYYRALSLYFQDEFEKCVNDANEAIRLNDSESDAFRTRALSNARCGRGEIALADADRAIELDQESWLTWVSRAYVKYYLRQFEDSLPDFARALELAQHSRLFSGRGLSCLALGRYEEAISDFDQALAREIGAFDRAVNFWRRCFSHLYTGQFQKARGDLDASFRARPDFPVCMRDLGIIRRLGPDLLRLIPGMTECEATKALHALVVKHLAKLSTETESPDVVPRCVVCVQVLEDESEVSVCRFLHRAHRQCLVEKHSAVEQDPSIDFCPSCLEHLVAEEAD